MLCLLELQPLFPGLGVFTIISDKPHHFFRRNAVVRNLYLSDSLTLRFSVR
jgi:hypothetical protein